MDTYINTIEPKPKHGQEGQHREFIGYWDKELSYSGDRLGCDIYCSNCNHWSTVKGTNILFSVCGKCKNCGTKFKY
mgnify:CR=1 FL=1|jgi:hypothetical protein|nr:MAG TPA: NUDIX domain protein [Caudoviricetes sp.]